jgi:hypothetical protein
MVRGMPSGVGKSGVGVGVWVGVAVGVNVGVGVAVFVAVAVGVEEGVCVAVAVGMGVSVGGTVCVGVALGVRDEVGDGTSDGVAVGVPNAGIRAMPACPKSWSGPGSGVPVRQYAALSSRTRIGRLAVMAAVFHRVLDLRCKVASPSQDSNVVKIPQLAITVKCVPGCVPLP